MTHRSLPNNTHPESPGMERQGFPTLSSISEPHCSLKWVRLNARRTHCSLPSNTHPASPGMEWLCCPALSRISEPHTSLEGVRLKGRMNHRLLHFQATHIPNHWAWTHLAAPHYQAYRSPTLPLKEWGWTQEGLIDSFTAKKHTSRITRYGVTRLPHIIKHIRAPHFPWRSEVECMTDSSTRSMPSNTQPESPGMKSLGCPALSSISEPHTSLEGVGLNARRSNRTLPSNTHPESRGMGWQGFPTLSSISEPHTSLEGVRLNARLSHRLVHCQATHIPNQRAWSHLAAPHYQAYQSPTLPLKEWGWTQEGVIVHCQATHIPNHQVMGDKATPHYQAYQIPTLPLKEWGWMHDWLIDSFTAKQHASRITGHGVTWLPRIIKHIRAPHFPWRSEVECKTDSSTDFEAKHMANKLAWKHLAAPHYQAYQTRTLQHWATNTPNYWVCSY